MQKLQDKVALVTGWLRHILDQPAVRNAFRLY